MKKVLYNLNDLTDDQINNEIKRVKLLIINSKNEILLGYAHKTYQFPGGHLEPGETVEEGLIREVKEETGIDIDIEKVTPFYQIKRYVKGYPVNEQNTAYVIDYFYIKTDESYHLNKVNYDKIEIEGNFKLIYVPCSEIKQLLINSVSDNRVNEIIVSEMLEVLEKFEKIRICS